MKKLLLLFAVLLTTVGASAYDFEVDGIYYNVLSLADMTCEVTYKDTNYKTYSGNVVIPASVTYSGRTLSVTEIGIYAFESCHSLTSVVIGNSVTTIGNYAFEHCSGLTSVVIPNSVTGIGGGAFSGCSSLTSVVIPNSVTEIGRHAFYKCSSLTSVEIPNSVTTIGYGAFMDCRSLKSVEIPKSVTKIGDYAFDDCDSLTSVHITDLAAWCKISFSSYLSNPIYYANNLYLNGELVTDLVIPNSVTTIGSSAFSGSKRLTSVEIPNSVTTIGHHAFFRCSSLTSVVIPNSVTTIGSSVFSGSSGLTSVVIGNSVTTIENYAFEYCSGLTSVVIGSSVRSISEYAFRSCSKLSEIYSLNIKPTSVYSNAFDGVDKLACVVKVPAEAVDAYKAAKGWKDFLNIVAIGDEDGVESVQAEGQADARAYTLDGREIRKGQRGLVIENGRKIIR